jgi:hypothetical protein
MTVYCRLGRLPDSYLELKVNSLASLPVSYHYSHNVYLHSSSTLFVSKHFQSTHFLPTTFLTPPHFPTTHFLSAEHLAFPSSLDLPLFLTDHILSVTLLITYFNPVTFSLYFLHLSFSFRTYFDYFTLPFSCSFTFSLLMSNSLLFFSCPH